MISYVRMYEIRLNKMFFFQNTLNSISLIPILLLASTHVYVCLRMSTHVYVCLRVSTYVYVCLPVSTHILCNRYCNRFHPRTRSQRLPVYEQSVFCQRYRKSYVDLSTRPRGYDPKCTCNYMSTAHQMNIRNNDLYLIYFIHGILNYI